MKLNTNFLKTDLLSGMVVFLVALPLCLGIAVASGAPPFAGIICGIIAGVVVGSLSSSNVSVSGPAAGLIAIVLVAINDLGYETFLVAVVIAGLIQLALGFAKAGTISTYFPTSVIEGMLVAIGIIIIKKEIPHAIGYDKAHEGDWFALENGSGAGFFSEIINSINYAHLGAIIITIVSLAILIAFKKSSFLKKIKIMPGALIVVIVGIIINELFKSTGSKLAISQDHLVTLPTASSVKEFIGQFSTPDFSAFTSSKVWIVGVTIAIVASIETLLCLEAGDKMDPLNGYSSANTE